MCKNEDGFKNWKTRARALLVMMMQQLDCTVLCLSHSSRAAADAGHYPKPRLLELPLTPLPTPNENTRVCVPNESLTAIWLLVD